MITERDRERGLRSSGATAWFWLLPALLVGVVALEVTDIRAIAHAYRMSSGDLWSLLNVSIQSKAAERTFLAHEVTLMLIMNSAVRHASAALVLCVVPVVTRMHARNQARVWGYLLSLERRLNAANVDVGQSVRENPKDGSDSPSASS